ncbi:MAG: hypothetical protein IIA14_10100, partial [SAR324 cluster bacterium]|nr:hypothetical protein [SAR324 cluster bacterium]
MVRDEKRTRNAPSRFGQEENGMIRLGVDVGGTFTDLVLLNDADGSVSLNKV